MRAARESNGGGSRQCTRQAEGEEGRGVRAEGMERVQNGRMESAEKATGHALGTVCECMPARRACDARSVRGAVCFRSLRMARKAASVSARPMRIQ